MVLCNVPRALVNLVENATGATVQQAVTAMMRISCERDARGAMIQQGCLSACIKLCRGVSTVHVTVTVIKSLKYFAHCRLSLLYPTAYITPRVIYQRMKQK